MSEKLSVPAAGITELIVDTLAEDAKVRTTEDLHDIFVTVKGEVHDSARLIVDDGKVRVPDGSVSRIEVPPGVALTAGDALGDLKITRFGGNMTFDEVMGDLRIEDVSGIVSIKHCYGDIRAEAVEEMHLRDCEGDFRFSGGNLQVESVSGDLRVSDAAGLQCLRVHGDLWVERLSGGVKVESAHGDVRLVDIEGAAGLAMIAGDFKVTNVRGALNAGQVHGDAQLEGPFPAEEGYAVSTSGDAQIRLMAEDDVRLVIKALGRVRSNLQLIPSADGSTTYTATVGEGKVRIVLSAHGDLRIEAAGGREEVRGPWDRRRGGGSDAWADLSGLSERIRQQVSASLAAAGINPETGEINMNLGFGRVRPGRGRMPDPPVPPAPPRPPRAAQPPQSQMSSEQMIVLTMLEEGRITPEEADSLLKALGA